MALATVVYRARDAAACARRGVDVAARFAACRRSRSAACPRSTASTSPPACRSRASSPACGRSPTWSATAARSISMPPPGPCTRTSRPGSPRSTWPTTTARPSSSPAAPGRTRARAASTCSSSPSGCRRPGPVTAADVRAAVERSLERLRVPAIDLLQFHAWNYADPVVARRALPPARSAARGAHPPPRADQRRCRPSAAGAGERHPGGVEPGERVAHRPPRRRARWRPCARSSTCRCSPTARCAAAGSATAGWAQAEPDWERHGTWSQMKYGRFIRVAGGWPALQRVLRAAQHVAARHGVSIANVATRFVMQQPGVAAVIVGARLGERAHIDDNARLCAFTLDEDDRAAARGGHRHADADSRRLRRRVPHAAVPHRLGRPQPSPRRLSRRRTRCAPAPTARAAVSAAPRGSRWPATARAVRSGRRIRVSGTTATHGRRVLGGADPAAQTHAVIDKIAGALQSLGGRLERRRAHPRLRVEPGALGAGGAGARRALRARSSRPTPWSRPGWSGRSTSSRSKRRPSAWRGRVRHARGTQRRIRRDAIGDTPLIRLERVVPDNGVEIWVKWEGANPTGSMKDRMALSMIRGAERPAASSVPGGRVVDYTGGSTGSSLAMVCAALGYQAHFVSSDAFAEEKLQTMRAFGARLDVVPSEGGKVTPALIQACLAQAKALSTEPNTFWTDQFNNPDNPAGYHDDGRGDARRTRRTPRRVRDDGRARRGASRATPTCSRSRCRACAASPASRRRAARSARRPGRSPGHRIEGTGAGLRPGELPRRPGRRRRGRDRRRRLRHGAASGPRGRHLRRHLVGRQRLDRAAARASAAAPVRGS